MSRTLPTECGHGYIADWADFADDGDGPEHCPHGCNDTAYGLTEAAAQIAHLTECLKARDAEWDAEADRVVELKLFAAFVADLGRPSGLMLRRRVTLDDLIARAVAALSGGDGS